MMSSGRSTSETAFLDASGMGPGGEEGEDVFFLTEDRLSPRDVDGLVDVYDAHTCSAALPCVDESAARSGSCATIESCRSSSGTHEGLLAPPPSAALSGSGNVAAPPRPAPLTRRQHLTKALALCHKKHGKRRKRCEAQARRRYGTRHVRTGANHRGGK